MPKRRASVSFDLPDLATRVAFRLGRKPSGKPPTRAELIAQAAQADKAGKALDAILCLSEIALQFDADIPKDNLRGLFEKYGKDAQVDLYRRATGSEKDPESGIKLFEKIQRAGLAHAHVIDAQRGALLNAAGHHKEARKAFLAALVRNPHMTLAWQDCGRTYLREYDTPTAWQCFAIAQEISPRHPAVLELKRQLTARLESDHPDFF